MGRFDGTKALIRSRNKDFLGRLFKNPFFIMLALLFISGKIITNLVMGASWNNALRSGLMGFMFYLLGCYFIHFFSEGIRNKKVEEGKESLRSFYISMGCYLLVVVILVLQIMNNNNIISLKVPVWSFINNSWRELIEKLAQNSHINATGLVGWPYLILYVFIPMLLLKRKNFSYPRFFGTRESRAALPFLGIYIIAFVFIRGISFVSVTSLAFVVIWPALGEEFFFRGIIQSVLSKTINNPVTAIVITSLLFTISHIPAYLFNYTGSTTAAFSSLLPVMFTSFFWGYGYHRSGVLWPWIMIHALSDIVGF